MRVPAWYPIAIASRLQPNSPARAATSGPEKTPICARTSNATPHAWKSKRVAAPRNVFHARARVASIRATNNASPYV